MSSSPDARIAGAVLATAGLAMLAAACGGSPATTPPPASTHATGAVAFAVCMRSQGVPNYPDPNSRGVFDKSKLTLQQLGVSSSRLQSAQIACSHLLPGGDEAPSQAQLQQARAQALRFSECIRAHGLANFPDPDRTGRIPDPATVGFDQGSATFQAANNACATWRPPYMPSNAAYNSWARTHTGSGS